MPTCGNCKQPGQTVEHVRSCYSGHYATLEATPVTPTEFAEKYVQAREFKAMALVNDVADSKYALVTDDKIIFYEVRTGTKGRWEGVQFLDRLVGAPGDWQRYPVKGAAKTAIMAKLDKDAAIRFSKHFTVCAVCSSPLSDPESLAAGLGPICAKRF